MVDIVLYIAISLDGYIARSEGSVDWLDTMTVAGEDYGYRCFFDSVDGIIMGSRTYEQILAFGAWPYGDKPCWVMSRRALSPAATTVQISRAPVKELLGQLAVEGMKRVWLVGGSAVVTAFEKTGQIGEYIISVIPRMLGDGVPLFKAGRPSRMLKLMANRSYPSGLV